MTETKLMDPNDPNLKECQRIAGLMELEIRKHKPEIETRTFAVAAVNSVMTMVPGLMRAFRRNRYGRRSIEYA
jgi:hypothetical protein